MVKRSSGVLEDDWNLITDLSLGSGYTAPEVTGCRVIKFTQGTLDDMLNGRPCEFIEKLVTLLDLIRWNRIAE